MGSKNTTPPPPDYGPLIEASKQQMDRAYELSKDQLEWAKERYGEDSAIAKQVIEQALARQSTQDANAAKDRERYETKFQPQEDKLIADADSYASTERQEYEAGKAMGSVGESFEASRRAAAQNLESFGVDPSSTRYAALDAGSRIAQAAAAAAAGNTARDATQDKARQMRSEAIQVGLTYPGNIATNQSLATQTGNSAVNSGIATTGSGASTMGTPQGYLGLAGGALGNWGNILNTSYQNQLDKNKADNDSSSGIGGLLGAGLGLLGSSGVGGATGLGMFLEDGGAVPTHASPSGGKAVDDVPARLTAGEFVIPADVLSWKGEEFFQKLIDGSRKAKPAAPAQPQQGAIPIEAPRFASRTAIPMGA